MPIADERGARRIKPKDSVLAGPGFDMKKLNESLEDQHLGQHATAGDPALADTPSPEEEQDKLHGSPEHMLKVLDQHAAASEPAPRYLALSPPYLPCTLSRHSLEDASLPKLELESHNRGKVVHVSRQGPLVRGSTGTLCVVVDASDNAAFLEITCSDPHYEAVFLREGCRIAIKEPFVTAGRDVPWCVKLDHLTDLCLIKPLADPTKTANENKELGNERYKKRRLGDAAAAYESGLSVVSPADGVVRFDLHRNLAQVYLSLGFCELAQRHAKAAQTQDTMSEESTPGSTKALLRGASASYTLQDFPAAKADLTTLLKIAPQNEIGRAEMLRVFKRLNEQRGTYDFDEMLVNATKSPLIDVASFTQRTVVSSSAGKGNGLFAAEDLNIGDLVLCEKAFAADFTPDASKQPMRTYDTGRKLFGAIPATLWTATVQVIVKNQSLASKILGLGGNWEGLGDQDIRSDDTRAIDVFQVHDIIARNSFSVPTPTERARSDQWGLYTAQSGASGTSRTPQNTAIFCHAAFINHSCLPNVEKRFIGDVIIIRATRRIDKGREILLDYAPGEFHDVRTRKTGFERSWQFCCTCELCTEEGKHTADVLDHRITVIDQVNKLSEELSRNIPASLQWDAEISRLEGLASDLRSLYGPSELPKALGYAYTTLALLHGTRKDFAKHIEAIGQAFESLGWYSPFATAGALEPKTLPLTSLDLNVPQLLYMAASAAMAMGHATIAKTIMEVEPKVYSALNGVMSGFVGIAQRAGGAA